MSTTSQARLSGDGLPGPKSDFSGVSFPLPPKGGPRIARPLLHLRNLLPGRWRRRVVIHGQSFWLPG